MLKTTDAIRIVATIILLIFVWTHSHWSVALCITLNFIKDELNSLITHLISLKRLENSRKP